MADIRLVFRDGHEERVTSDLGETVLAAALRSGLELVHQCESGSCGTCIVRQIEGESEIVPGRSLALLEGEVRDGYRLACSIRPLGACAFALDYPTGLITERQQAVHQARVSNLEWVSDTVIRLDLRLDDPEEFIFAPGQYVRIRVPGTDQWRSYSMATTPGDLPRLSFLVRFLKGGAMSSWLEERAAPDMEVEIAGPMGSFGLLEDDGPILMLAGGTGLAPLLAMLDELRTRPRSAPEVLLGFGCNTAGDRFFEDELELRAFWMPRLEVRATLLPTPEGEFDCRIGDAVSLIESADLEKPALTSYLCGPPGMIQAARSRLIEGGIPPEQIRSEQFRPSEA